MYALYSQPYLDKYNQCYKNIVTIHSLPKGPLANLVHPLHMPYLSQFKNSGYCDDYKTNRCVLALKSLKKENNCFIMKQEEIPDLFNFLLTNNYIIDTNITQMMYKNQSLSNDGKSLICFISYKE
jgi:hypothetical protein